MSCKKTYCDYGSYLRTRGFDKEVCEIQNEIQSNDQDILVLNNTKYNKSGGLINGNVEINGNLDMMGTLDMACNSILDVSGISFCDMITNTLGTPTTTTLKLGDMSSNIHNVLLPSFQINNTQQPISLTRTSVFTNDTSYNVVNGTSVNIEFGNENINQLNIIFDDVNKTQVISPLEISGCFVDIYINVKLTASNNTTLSYDISGINGNTFLETIDVRSVSKSGIYNLALGPLMINNDDFTSGSDYMIILKNDGQNGFDILKTKIVIKAYYL